MWITNAGSADLFTVFAKVGGEQFTAFLVERSWPGVEIGPEERKMGIKGSSTCPVYFNNVRVPAENVLGEIGRGHIIAFNILNLGRLKLGPFAVGAAKEVLGASLQYAGSRVAFGKPIAEFGLIQEKLAEMAIRIYAAESMVYRTAGAIAQQTPELDFDQPDAAVQELKVVEEFAIECSLVKVFASEMLDFVVDEGVQIHGGYGYHQDYAVERAYRDSRINRIFEGTNEINRLLATGMLLKRAQRKQLPLVEAVLELQSRVLNMKAEAGAPGGERLIAGARDTVLFLLGIAYERFGTAMDEQQEILAAIADAMIDLYTMQSVWLRTEKLKMRGRGAGAEKMTALYLRSAIERVTQAAYRVLGACTEGDTLRTHLAILRRFTRWEPVNGVKFRREIAGRLLEAGRYIV
jgi:alkylation response protein AidB-like acyl-CoA dehydrogenase